MCKATFVLQPERPTLAAEQEPPADSDEHWDDDDARSVHVPSDRAPYKPAVDVCLVGSAFAPNQQPARSFTVRCAVANVDKLIEIWCDRAVRVHDGQLLEGPRITKMPLRWERAAGGPETQNPSGMRFDAQPDRYGSIPIPNLQPAGTHFAALGDTFAPIGYGPISPRWPSRIQRLHKHAATFHHRGWESRPLPDDFDYAYFNMAPPDQQIVELVPGERILLENLHPEHPRLVTALPGLWPNAVAVRATGEQEAVALIADTLCIDTDRGIFTIVWRGRIGLRHSSEAGRVTVTLEKERRFAAETENGAAHTLAPGLIGGDLIPFVGTSPEARPPISPAARGANDVLPFGRESPVAPMARGAPMPPLEAGAETVFVAPPLKQQPSPPSPMAPPAPIAPALVRGPDVAPPPPLGMMVSLSSPEPGPLRPSSLSIGQRFAGGGADFPLAAQEKPGMPAGIRAPSPEIVDKPPQKQEAVLGGATAASDAAAQTAAQERAGRMLRGRAPVELVWLGAGSIGRIRRQTIWKDLLAGVKPRPEDEDMEDDLPPARRIPAKDRRETLTILSRGEPLDVSAVEDALRRAMDDEEGFSPPLVLAAGELEMRFDELESLKALLAALSPHVSTDKRLEEAVSRVQESLKLPWTQGASSVLDEMADSLRKLFTETRKGMQAGLLDPHVERSLLEGRHYRKRTVFGQPRIVAALTSPGMKPVLPVYLPDTLGKDLPAIRRLPVRLIAELRPRAEQGETSDAALRVVALGRVVDAGW